MAGSNAAQLSLNPRREGVGPDSADASFLLFSIGRYFTPWQVLNCSSSRASKPTQSGTILGSGLNWGDGGRGAVSPLKGLARSVDTGTPGLLVREYSSSAPDRMCSPVLVDYLAHAHIYASYSRCADAAEEVLFRFWRALVVSRLLLPLLPSSVLTRIDAAEMNRVETRRAERRVLRRMFRYGWRGTVVQARWIVRSAYAGIVRPRSLLGRTGLLFTSSFFWDSRDVAIP